VALSSIGELRLEIGSNFDKLTTTFGMCYNIRHKAAQIYSFKADRLQYSVGTYLA